MKKRKMRPKSSPTRRAPSPPKFSIPAEVIDEEELSVKSFDEAPREQSGKRPKSRGEGRASASADAVPEDIDGAAAVSPEVAKKPKAGLLGRGGGKKDSMAMVSDHFANEGSPLSREALGYNKNLSSQTPEPDTSKSQEKKNKMEPNFVKIAKNNGKGESLEEIAKHDKIEKRNKFAQNLYKQK